ncbi:MAG: DNA-directed RNA polymerase subunit alpha [Deltaproteobacteria bacterium]|nr:MAG: DNA-directed RNA polymerase subunit alpha [Deltaproteobacteria bacterium]
MQMNWKSLIKPKKVEYNLDTLTETYGKFVAEPLERGFGITLGNALRRIILSALQGAAITSVKIEGVLHEFSTIPGVREDVTDIILNLKEVVIKYTGSGIGKLYVDKKGPGEVKVADFQHDPAITLLNPEHHIATLSEEAHLQMEMTVGRGRGYVPAERNKSETQPIGTIPIDSIFSPIRRVNYNVTNARVGHVTDYDKLIMEIWTDGSITPVEAVSFAAKILKDQVSFLIEFEETEEEEVEVTAEEPKKDEIDENLYRSVDELELSVRAANCLKNANILLIGELVTKTESEMTKIKNFGRKSLNEIKEILQEMNLSFGMKLPNFDPAKARQMYLAKQAEKAAEKAENEALEAE